MDYGFRSEGAPHPNLERKQVFRGIFFCFGTGALASQAAKCFSHRDWADVPSLLFERVEGSSSQEGGKVGRDPAGEKSV